MILRTITFCINFTKRMHEIIELSDRGEKERDVEHEADMYLRV